MAGRTTGDAVPWELPGLGGLVHVSDEAAGTGRVVNVDRGPGPGLVSATTAGTQVRLARSPSGVLVR